MKQVPSMTQKAAQKRWAKKTPEEQQALIDKRKNRKGPNARTIPRA